MSIRFLRTLYRFPIAHRTLHVSVTLPLTRGKVLKPTAEEIPQRAREAELVAEDGRRDDVARIEVRRKQAEGVREEGDDHRHAAASGDTDSPY